MMETAREVRLSLTEVTVAFGATVALDGLTLDVRAGEVLGLLGHNGAGKSTLLNVVSGAVRLASGSVSIDGVAVPSHPGPRRMAELGVTIVRQEPALAGNLTVLDNARVVFGRRRGLRAEVETALGRVGATGVSVDTPVEDLSLGERQLVDIARGLLAGDTRVLMLDEPTAGLGNDDARRLHGLIREFARSGVSVIYVSHRLPDILDVCDRVVALRDGRLTLDAESASLALQDLSTALAPEKRAASARSGVRPGEVRMRFADAAHEASARAGEVVGLFGVAAGPQFALAAACAHPVPGVELSLGDRPFRPRTVRHAIEAGVHYVPGDRDAEGLISGLSALDNYCLPWRGRLSRRALLDDYARTERDFGITGPGPDAPISSFSGGNRQKHLLGMWIHPVTPGVLVLVQPTQGVDVGAKADIVDVVRGVAATGTAVIVASAEADEVAQLCDRAYVVSAHGQSELVGAALSEAGLLQALLDLTPSEGTLAR